jgi:hypothetical protein
LARVDVRAVAAAVAFGACVPSYPVASRIPEAAVVVEEMKLGVFDRSRAEFDLSLRVENPGVALRVEGVDFEVLAEGALFATATMALDAALPPGVSRLTLPVRLSYLDLPYFARRRAEAGEPVALVVRGELRPRGAHARLPFDASAAGTVASPRR